LHRISGLDGVRALAIALVIGIHILPHNPYPWLRGIVGGQDGVGIFFVLSGFLVTTLLLREQAKFGRIDIPHFYFRRAMRILPPLFAYLLVIVGAGYAMGAPVPAGVVASVVFFYHNMTSEGTWMLEHTWSLAVEEQFYLLWPLLLVLLLRISWRVLIYVSLVLILCAPLIRSGGSLLHLGWMHHKESYLLPTRMDALLSGSMTACLVGTARFERVYAWLTRFYWVAPVFLFGVSPYLSRHYRYTYDYTLGYTLQSLVGAFFILWLSRNEQHVLGRVANWKPISVIGAMSYSIYLWQTLGTHYADGLIRVLLGCAFMAAMAYLSFRLVERPAAQLRSHLDRVWFGAKLRREEPVESAVAV
jgi:peptidoglycan/LPS O-acetylase OafA/YrhL